jgi:hypothetical protein
MKGRKRVLKYWLQDDRNYDERVGEGEHLAQLRSNSLMINSTLSRWLNHLIRCRDSIHKTSCELLMGALSWEWTSIVEIVFIKLTRPCNNFDFKFCPSYFVNILGGFGCQNLGLLVGNRGVYYYRKIAVYKQDIRGTFFIEEVWDTNDISSQNWTINESQLWSIKVGCLFKQKEWSQRTLASRICLNIPYRRGKLWMVDLLVLISSDQRLLYNRNYVSFYKTGYLIKEVNCTEPSPSVRVPWLKYW